VVRYFKDNTEDVLVFEEIITREFEAVDSKLGQICTDFEANVGKSARNIGIAR
jgi:hypothetical protein